MSICKIQEALDKENSNRNWKWQPSSDGQAVETELKKKFGDFPSCSVVARVSKGTGAYNYNVEITLEGLRLTRDGTVPMRICRLSSNELDLICSIADRILAYLEPLPVQSAHVPDIDESMGGIRRYKQRGISGDIRFHDDCLWQDIYDLCEEYWVAKKNND